MRLGSKEQVCPRCNKSHWDAGRREWQEFGVHNKIGHILGIVFATPLLALFGGCISWFVVWVLLNLLPFVSNSVAKDIAKWPALLVAVVAPILYVREEVRAIRESCERSETQAYSHGRGIIR